MTARYARITGILYLLLLILPIRAVSDGPSPGTIAWAKSFPDDTLLPAPLEDKMVSRTFPGLGCFYIQEQNGSAGIRVNNELYVLNLSPGDIVTIPAATVASSGGERVLNAEAVVKQSSTAQVKPFAMNNRFVTGGSFNEYTPGPAGAIGLSSSGLFTRTWGKVTSIGPGYFYLDDGSRLRDGSGNVGVRVTEAFGIVPKPGDWIVVDGVAGIESLPSGLSRVIRLGTASQTIPGNESGISFLSTTPCPVNPIAISTGSGQISIYWNGVPGATGYNIYRGTTAGGEDYSQPINGSGPVSNPAYTGGNVYIFTDNGLVDGKEYHYTIKATGTSGSSSASDEVSEVPSPYAVPWNTADSASIISAIQSGFYPNFDYIRAVGPDGRVYDSVSSTPATPDGTIIPGTDLVSLAVGRTVALPEDSGTDSIYRRVTSLAGYTGSIGKMSLPGASGIHLAPGRTDTPYIYLGSYDDSLGTEINAGLYWCGTDGWGAVQTSAYHSDTNTKRMLINYSNNLSGNFAPGTTVTIRQFISEGRSICVLSMSGTSIGGQPQRVCLVNAYPSKAGTVRVKRVHSIAHGYPREYRSTGSYLHGGEVHEMRLLDIGYDPVPWTESDTAEDYAFPASPAVTWHVISFFTDEDEITLGP